MKKLLILLVLSSSALAQTTTWTGIIKDVQGNIVTSGKVNFTLTQSVDATIPGSARFVPTLVSCQINSDGTMGIGSGACVTTMNTALSPTGTSYKVCIQPYFAQPGSCFYGYAIIASQDITTQVPTPSTGPFNYNPLAQGIPGPPGPDGPGCGSTNCIIALPSGNQTITQPSSSILSVNRFDSPYLPRSVQAFGAIDDNSTDNTAAFAAMESSTLTDFFLPFTINGVYKTTQVGLSKHYWGPGTIMLNNVYLNRTGLPNSILAQRTIGLDVTAYSLLESTVDFTFIGDSITDCYISSVECNPVSIAYPMRIQSYINNKTGGIGQGGYMSGPQMSRLTKTGSTSAGAHGPLLNDLILQSGATASFTGLYVSSMILSTWNGGGGGTITISGLGGTWGTINTSSGSGETKSSIFTAPGANNLNTQTITMACSLGPCEITNIVAGTLPVAGTNTTSNFIQVVANGGYATANFTSTAVLDSIQFNRAFKSSSSNGSVALIALGTNDIYNPGTAVTVAVFKANLQTIVSGLKARGIVPILTVPLHAGPATYVPVNAPFASYRDAIYQVAEGNECRVVDLSELDLAAGNLLQSDGLHPTQDGYGAIASWVMNKLWLDKIQTAPLGQFANPITVQANQTAPSRAVMNLNDQNNINRGTFYAIDQVLSPVPQWSLGSIALEGLLDLNLSSYGGVIHLQTQGRTVNALTLSNTLVSSPLPLSFGGGATLPSSTNVPTVGSVAGFAAGTLACIKSAGPPVVVGFCTAAPVGTGCTCN